MKKIDNKHKLAYQDVFLYTRITSRLLDTNFNADISSPFEYKDGKMMDIFIDEDVITGIGQRNFQRDRLHNSRGKVIIAYSEKHKSKIVGKWSKVKNEVTLYPTEKLLPEELKVLGILQKHLTENNIAVIIEIDEKKRYRNEVRRKRGDRIQSRDIPHSSSDDEEEY